MLQTETLSLPFKQSLYALCASEIASKLAPKIEVTTTSDNGAYRELFVSETRANTLYERVNGQIHLNLHAGQMKAWQSERRIVAMVAGSQGGKTAFGPWWLYREIQRRGGGDYIAVTATYDLFKLKLLPEMRRVFETELGVGKYWAGDKVIELRNPETGQFEAQRADDPMWGRIILRSAQADGGLESTTAKAALLDEAGQDEFTLQAYEATRRRVTLHRGRMLITTTPYNLGWLKQLIVDRSDFDPDIELVQFDSVENPMFPPEEFEALRKTMPEWKFNMFHRGLFSRPPGMIFNDFKDEYRERGGHKVRPFVPPSEWPRLVGVDPGIIHTCKVWLAHDPLEDVYYLFRESLGDRKGAKEHAAESLDVAKRNNERVIRWAVGAKSEIYHREDWIAAGARGVVAPDYADVEAGIDKVIALLRGFKLFIVDTCTGTLDQFATYARKVDEMGTATKDIKDKERYHYLDALRYIAQTLDTRSRAIQAEVRRWA